MNVIVSEIPGLDGRDTARSQCIRLVWFRGGHDTSVYSANIRSNLCIEKRNGYTVMETTSAACSDADHNTKNTTACRSRVQAVGGEDTRGQQEAKRDQNITDTLQRNFLSYNHDHVQMALLPKIQWRADGIVGRREHQIDSTPKTGTQIETD